MNKRAILSCLGVAVFASATVAGQGAKVTSETGFVAAINDSKITLSNVPVGGAPGGWQQAGAPGQGGEGRAVVMRRGPDGQTQEVKLTPEEEAKLREKMKSEGGHTRMVVRENGQERELTPEEAEKMREKMKAQGGNVQFRTSTGGTADATHGGPQGATVVRSSEPMKLSDFALDAKTKKKGEIKVGARVTVTFREENGQKIATSIQPAQ